MRVSLRPPRSYPRSALLGLVVALATLAASAADAATPGLIQAERAEFGERFPASTFANLNAGVAGAAKIDLKDVLGKEPVVFCYWIADNPHSELVLQEVQKLADEIGGSKVALYGVAAAPLGVTGDKVAEWMGQVRERIGALKIHVPVFYDEGFRLYQQLAVRTVPSIAVVDGEGRLRLSGAGSLSQVLEYKMDLADAIRRVAGTGQLGTYGALPTYYPANEMVGKKAPDFEAPSIGEGAMRHWSGLLSPDKVNVLIFWSVECPHCKRSIPEINAWIKQHAGEFNVVTAASVLNDAMRTKTEEFCKQEGLVFPTLEDKDLKIGGLYEVTSTPTIFIIRPDGIIDSVLLSGEMDFGQAFEAKRRQILGSPKS